MNLSDRLRSLAHLLSKNRYVGYTTLNAKNAIETGGIVITHNFDHAREIERQFKVVAKSADVNLEGQSGPFWMDHFAVASLFNRAANKIEMVQEENEKLIEKIERMESISEAESRIISRIHSEKRELENIIKERDKDIAALRESLNKQRNSYE